jgi:pimeloyl-ACP methyl ester carboxylesterase
MAEVAQWVAEWCGLERVVLLGHGMGALVALDWARRASDRIEGLVLCCAGAALATDEQAIEQMRRVKNGKASRPFDPSRVCKTSGPEMMRRAYMEGIGTDPRATLGDLEAVRRWTETLDEEGYDADAPGAFRGRVLLAEGESAPLEQRDLAKRWFTPVGECTSTLIAGASHFLPLERPAPFAAALRRFAVPAARAAAHTPAHTPGKRKTKGPS